MLVQVPLNVDGARVVGAMTSVPCSKMTNDSKHHDLDGSAYQVTRDRAGVDTLRLKGTEKLCDQAQCRYLDDYFGGWVDEHEHVFRQDHRRVRNDANTGVFDAAVGAAVHLGDLDVKNYIDKSTNPRAVEQILRKLGFMSDLDSTGRRPYTRVCESVESWIKSGRFVDVFNSAAMVAAPAVPALPVNDPIVSAAVDAVIKARRVLRAAGVNMDAGTAVADGNNLVGDVHVVVAAAVDADGTTPWLTVARTWTNRNVLHQAFGAVTVTDVTASAVAAIPDAAGGNIDRIVGVLLGNVLARMGQVAVAGVGGTNKNVVVVRQFVLTAINALASPQKEEVLRACQLAALAVNRIIDRVQPITANVPSVGDNLGPGGPDLTVDNYKHKINSGAWCAEFRNYSKFLEVLSRMVAHYNSIVRKAVVQAESVMHQFVNVNYFTMGRIPVVYGQRGGSGVSGEQNSFVDEINAMRANAQLTLQTGGYKFPVETLKYKQENNCDNSAQESNMVGGHHGMLAARHANVALACDRIKHLVKTQMSILEGRGYVISNKANVEREMEEYSEKCKKNNKLLENLQKLTRLVQSNKGPEDRNIDTDEIEKLIKHYNTNAKAMIVSEDQIMALLQTMVQRVADSSKTDGEKQVLPYLPAMAAAAV
jgi:hypothetical protein